MSGAAAQPGGKAVPTVLFVDDDDMVCRSMSRCMERWGFAVTTVTSAEAALAEVKNRRYDAIVTDYNMPTMSGAQLLERLLALDASLRGRIILTSGDLHSESTDALLERTGCRGLQKPFQLAELSLALKAAVTRSPFTTLA